jgi:hypothetical protein
MIFDPGYNEGWVLLSIDNLLLGILWQTFKFDVKRSVVFGK